MFVRKPAGVVCALERRPKKKARPAVQLALCDACGRIGELVQLVAPNPKPETRRAAGEPVTVTIRVHAGVCQTPRRIRAAARFVLGGRRS